MVPKCLEESSKSTDTGKTSDIHAPAEESSTGSGDSVSTRGGTCTCRADRSWGKSGGESGVAANGSRSARNNNLGGSGCLGLALRRLGDDWEDGGSRNAGGDGSNAGCWRDDHGAGSGSLGLTLGGLRHNGGDSGGLRSRGGNDHGSRGGSLGLTLGRLRNDRKDGGRSWLLRLTVRVLGQDLSRDGRGNGQNNV